MIRCIPIPCCTQCPYLEKHYGQFECAKFNHQVIAGLSASNGIVTPVPDWCPLPPHPSFKSAAPSDSVEEGKQ